MSDSPREPSRIAGYLTMMGLYGGSVLSTALAARARGESLPASYPAKDLVVGAIAVHKFARLVAKDGVTTPIRAPFTEWEENAGSAEVNESPREGHVQHVGGEILSCPFCLAPWIATAYVAGLALSPRLARAWASTFAVVGGSDFLQHAYGRVRTD